MPEKLIFFPFSDISNSSGCSSKCLGVISSDIRGNSSDSKCFCGWWPCTGHLPTSLQLPHWSMTTTQPRGYYSFYRQGNWAPCRGMVGHHHSEASRMPTFCQFLAMRKQRQENFPGIPGKEEGPEIPEKPGLEADTMVPKGDPQGGIKHAFFQFSPSGRLVVQILLVWLRGMNRKGLVPSACPFFPLLIQHLLSGAGSSWG